MALVEFISISIVNFKRVPFSALEDLKDQAEERRSSFIGTRTVSKDHKLKDLTDIYTLNRGLIFSDMEIGCERELDVNDVKRGHLSLFQDSCQLGQRR